MSECSDCRSCPTIPELEYPATGRAAQGRGADRASQFRKDHAVQSSHRVAAEGSQLSRRYRGAALRHRRVARRPRGAHHRPAGRLQPFAALGRRANRARRAHRRAPRHPEARSHSAGARFHQFAPPSDAGGAHPVPGRAHADRFEHGRRPAQTRRPPRPRPTRGATGRSRGARQRAPGRRHGAGLGVSGGRHAHTGAHRTAGAAGRPQVPPVGRPHGRPGGLSPSGAAQVDAPPGLRVSASHRRSAGIRGGGGGGFPDHLQLRPAADGRRHLAVRNLRQLVCKSAPLAAAAFAGGGGVGQGRGIGDRLPAAGAAALHVHRHTGGFGLPGARRADRRPHHGQGRVAGQIVHPAALGVRLRGAGHHGHAHHREQARPLRHHSDRPVHDLFGAACRSTC